MQSISVSRLFRAGKLKRDAFGANVFSAGKPLRIARPLDAEILEGRLDGRGRSGGGSSDAISLTKKLLQRSGSSRKLARQTLRQGAEARTFDRRQRAIVKIHYFSHGAGGAAALRAHARYVSRDAASRSAEPALDASPSSGPDGAPAEAKARAHSHYLAKGQSQQSVFYDAVGNGVDGADRAAWWARQDRRHFRLILAPENGSRLGDLKGYTREVMIRAEAALGTRLEWVAVDHWDTDNPHTHVILRGRHGDGRDLIIPREFVQHGFRSAARDVATERLGNRTPDDERLALQREARAHRPTRLDPLIEAQLDPAGQVRVAELKGSSPALTDALKARARELKRLGLATEVRRNVLRFELGWRDALKAMELHLDVRKALLRERAVNRMLPFSRLDGR